MKKISANKIKLLVKFLAIEANISLRSDVLKALLKAYKLESNQLSKNALKIIIENAKIAKKNKIPICQDTGMAVVFCDIGDKVQIVGDVNKAIDDGIRFAYKEGSFRKSIVKDPFLRSNTKTNTPAVVHYNFIKGEKIKITVIPKGFGCENASVIKMFNPTDTEKDIENFVVGIVESSGADACPPLVIGIGIGGTMDKAASLATEAIIRPINKSNSIKHIAKLEKDILTKVNKTGIGPAALGGKITALGVNILSFPTHIAGLPVCVKISCHATRSATGIV